MKPHDEILRLRDELLMVVHTCNQVAACCGVPKSIAYNALLSSIRRYGDHGCEEQLEEELLWALRNTSD